MAISIKENCSSFFASFVISNNLICDVLIKLRPYDGLIDIKRCSDAAGLKFELIRKIQRFVTFLPVIKTTAS